MFKPIKDGINNYVRGVVSSFGNSVMEYQETGGISQDTKNDLLLGIVGGTFGLIIITVITVLICVFTLVTPFLLIVSGLMASVISFVGDMIINSMAGGSKKDGEKSNSFEEIVDILNVDDNSQSKGEITLTDLIVAIIYIAGIICSAIAVIKSGVFDKVTVGLGT